MCLREAVPHAMFVSEGVSVSCPKLKLFCSRSILCVCVVGVASIEGYQLKHSSTYLSVCACVHHKDDGLCTSHVRVETAANVVGFRKKCGNEHVVHYVKC